MFHEVLRCIMEGVLHSLLNKYKLTVENPHRLLRVSVGSKALTSRGARICNLAEVTSMVEQSESYKDGKMKKGMRRKAKKGSAGFDNYNSNKTSSGMVIEGNVKDRKTFKHKNASAAQASFIRKQVDPETAQYFSEISNLFESNEVDLEERSVICGNALEETRGKELELATDYIISHTLQSLLEGCDVDHLCDFLRSCAKDIPNIAMDRSGSHVAETAIKSLAVHLQDQEAQPVIVEALTRICKAIAANSADMMSNCYGSHVLRSLLCLCKGVQLDKSEYYVSKPATALAERLSSKAFPSKGADVTNFQSGFPDLLKLLISEMLQHTKNHIMTMQVDQYSSLVLQTALKLLAGNDEELLHVIPVLLGCNENIIAEGNFIETTRVQQLLNLLKETAFSHLMEVILEVAPETLYNEIFIKVFRNSLFKLSSHECANFVVQALISHARSQDHMELIWEELGLNIGDLFKMGRSGVIAALLAASKKLHTLEDKSCQLLAAAVCSKDESSNWIVPRLLFLDSYFTCEDKASWSWQSGAKMHVIGCLILQTIFQFKKEYIQPYINCITSMEASQVFETAKDAGGAWVIEAFLCSDASGKQKRRLVTKLQGHFGELALTSSGSFTVEKCFNVSNLSLREAMMSELLTVRSELPKTKQGPYLLRKLDVEGFAARPDHWRSKQASKESTYKEFHATFGSGDTKSTKNNGFLVNSSKNKSHPKGLKDMRREIDKSLNPTTQFLSMSGYKKNPKKSSQETWKHNYNRKSKRPQKKRDEGGFDNKAAAANKTTKKRQRNNDSSEFSKKLKAV